MTCVKDILMKFSKINEFFKYARELKGDSLFNVSSSAGISYQSLQKYEKGQSALSKETLKRIAETLSINMEYVEGRSNYPFKNENGLIKMFIQEKLLYESFEPLYWIASLNKRIQILTLIAPGPERLKTYIGLPLIYAMAFTDSYNNIFILRRKKERDIINWAGEFPLPIVKLTKISQLNNSILSIAQAGLKERTYEKIRDWHSLSRTDIEPYFKKANLVEDANSVEIDLSYTVEEKNQRDIQRSIGIEALSELDFLIIKAMRENEVTHADVLKYIKSNKLTANK
jgi:transcriptional regulator with XRE-family HTH domain